FRRLFELLCACRRAVGPAQPAMAAMSHSKSPIPSHNWRLEERKSMKRTFAIILAALAAGALFGGLVHAVLVAAHLSEPAATTVSRPPPTPLRRPSARGAARGGVLCGGPASAPPRQSFRHRLRATRSHRGPGGGANGRGQWRAEFGYRQWWSRHRQRRSRWRSGVRVGADRRGPQRTGSGPPPAYRVRAGTNDVSSTRARRVPAGSTPKMRSSVGIPGRTASG